MKQQLNWKIKWTISRQIKWAIRRWLQMHKLMFVKTHLAEIDKLYDGFRKEIERIEQAYDDYVQNQKRFETCLIGGMKQSRFRYYEIGREDDKSFHSEFPFDFEVTNRNARKKNRNTVIVRVEHFIKYKDRDGLEIVRVIPIKNIAISTL